MPKFNTSYDFKLCIYVYAKMQGCCTRSATQNWKMSCSSDVLMHKFNTFVIRSFPAAKDCMLKQCRGAVLAKRATKFKIVQLKQCSKMSKCLNLTCTFYDFKLCCSVLQCVLKYWGAGRAMRDKIETMSCICEFLMPKYNTFSDSQLC